jgi:YcxB-like protein
VRKIPTFAQVHKFVTTITVRHRPIDILRLGIYATLRSASLKWTLLAVALVVFGINLNAHDLPLDAFSLVAIILTTVLFTAGALLFMLALILLSTLLRNRRGSPAAETHAYSVTDAGLSRKSATSETLLKWGGARSLNKNKRAIYVGVSGTTYFVLPRHAFADEQEYRSFWASIQKLAAPIG